MIIGSMLSMVAVIMEKVTHNTSYKMEREIKFLFTKVDIVYKSLSKNIKMKSILCG